MTGILALDPGVSTGWAFYNGRRVYYGTGDFHNSEKSDGKTYHDCEEWLTRLVRRTNPNVIIFETPIFRGKRSKFLFGFACLITLIAYRHGAEITEVNLQTIKKFVAGSGRADKEQMLQSVQSLGYRPSDDHQADAIALLHYVLHQSVPATGVTVH